MEYSSLVNRVITINMRCSMNMVYNKYMKKLWELTGEIGVLGEHDVRYSNIYRILSEALDEAEIQGLIKDRYNGDY